MTRAEAVAFNKGVAAVLAIAAASAERIAARGTSRHIPEGFAVAALSELADAARSLLVDLDPSLEVRP